MDCIASWTPERLQVPSAASDRSVYLDFYCAEAKLAVEVDGAIHDQPDQVAHDQRRRAWLGERGVKVVRVRAIHVKDELEGVLGFILAVVRARQDAG